MRNPLATVLEKTYAPLPKPKRRSLHLVHADKGADRFILFFTLDNAAECLRTVARWASNPELNFDMADAYQLAQEIARIREEEKARHE